MCPFRRLKHSAGTVTEKLPASGPIDGLPIPKSPSTSEETANASCTANVLVDEKGKIIVDVEPVKGCDLVRKQIHDSTPGNKKWMSSHFRSGGKRLDEGSQTK
jgi:hypothetical protein